MRVLPDEYLTLPLRAHAVLQGVPLYDVSVVDLPGGGEGRSIADIRALDSSVPSSKVATVLYDVRCFLGRVFRWDRGVIRREQSLLDRLSESDLRRSEVAPGTPDGDFLVLYQFANESVAEILNATVHGFICKALTRTATGYRFYLAIYVIPVSWITRPYLFAIEPFRRILYPAVLRRIRRAWQCAYPDGHGQALAHP
jgi:hypothetical protein